MRFVCLLQPAQPIGSGELVFLPSLSWGGIPPTPTPHLVKLQPVQMIQLVQLVQLVELVQLAESNAVVVLF